MLKFKKGKLPAGKSGAVVPYRKQAISIEQREHKDFKK